MTAAVATTTMREAFAATVDELLSTDPRVAVVLAAIGADQLRGSAGRHPGRVLDVGIREQLMIGVAAGLALEGLRPIAHSYVPFLVERPFEQLKVDLGHQHLGAVLVSVGASYDWAEGGATHRGAGDVALLDTLEGWVVHVPATADEVAPLLRAAVATDDRVYLRLTAEAASRPTGALPGRSAVLRRGNRGTVIAVGPSADAVLAAIGEDDVTILAMTTVRPFDAATLLSTLVRPDVVLVEPYLAGTSSGVVAEVLQGVPSRLLALGVGREEVRRYGQPADHDRVHGLDPVGLRTRIRAFLAP